MTRRKREIVGLTNERDFPHLVELALPLGGITGTASQDRSTRGAATGANLIAPEVAEPVR